jgi:hypothetical protein
VRQETTETVTPWSDSLLLKGIVRHLQYTSGAGDAMAEVVNKGHLGKNEGTEPR